MAPFDPADAYVPYAPEEPVHLRQILAKHSPRNLSKTLTCQFHSTLLQIQPPASGSLGLQGGAVTILEHFDDSCEVLWHSTILPHTRISKPRGALREQGRKEVLFSSAPHSHRP